MDHFKGKTRAEIEKELNERARKDHAFKQKLISHPDQALSEIGLKVPSHAKIHVHEEKGDDWHLTLWKTAPGAKNLSDEDLGNMRAGACSSACGHAPTCT